MKGKRNMATHKQILAGLLALVMVFTTAFSMPVTGYAAEATGDMGAAQTGAEAGLTDPTEDGGEQQPGGDDEQQSGGDDEQQPGGDDEQQPGGDDEQQPSGDDEQQSGEGDEQQSGEGDEQSGEDDEQPGEGETTEGEENSDEDLDEQLPDGEEKTAMGELRSKAYTGEVNGETLVIDEIAAVAAGMEWTDENLLAIFDYYVSKNQKFTVIQIGRKEQLKLTDTVWNKALSCLDEANQERKLVLQKVDQVDSEDPNIRDTQTLTYTQPTQLTVGESAQELDFSSVIDIDDMNNKVIVKRDAKPGAAAKVDWDIRIAVNSDFRQKLNQLIGTATLITLEQGDTETDVTAEVTNTKEAIALHIADADRLEAGQYYDLFVSESGYYGEITSIGNDKYNLYIGNKDNEYDAYGLVTILDRYKGKYVIQDVTIAYGKGDAMYYGEVARAIHNYFFENGENDPRMIITYTQENGVEVTATFRNSTLIVGEDTKLDYALTAENGYVLFQNVSLEKLANPDAYDNLNVHFTVPKDNALYQETQTVWKDEVGSETGFKIWTDSLDTTPEDSIDFSGSCTRTAENLEADFAIKKTKAGQSYRLDASNFFGEVDDEEFWNKRLSIYCKGEQGCYTEAELEKLRKYWQMQGEEFDSIDCSIDGMVIRKDLVNGLGSLMKDTQNGSLTITCDNYTWTENDEIAGGYEYCFTLHGFGEQTKDIPVRLAIKGVERQGVGVTLKQKMDFNADQVELKVSTEYGETGTAEWKDLVLGLTGRDSIGEEEELNRAAIMILGSQYEDGAYYYEINSGYASFHLNNVIDMQANKEYRFLGTVGEKTFSRGSTTKIENLNYIPDKGKKITWKCYNTDVATIDADGNLNAFGWPGSEFYFSASSVSNGKPFTELWIGKIEEAALESISFAEKEVKIELPDTSVKNENLSDEDQQKEWDAQRERWLDVRFEPSTAGIANYKLKWESSDPDVVEPVMETIVDETNTKIQGCNGRIRALKAGTATIKVTYQQEEADAIVASCTVTVTEPLSDKNIGIKEIKPIHLLKNFDKKLGDIKLSDYVPERTENDTRLEGSWSWVDESISLAPYEGACHFQAMFTAADGRTTTRMIYVNVLSLTGVNIIKLHATEQDGQTTIESRGTPDTIYLSDTDENFFGTEYVFNEGISEEDARAMMKRYADKYTVTWGWAKLKAEAAPEKYGADSWQVTGSNENKKVSNQKITVTVSDKTTKKALVKTAVTVKVISTDAQCIDWDQKVSINEAVIKVIPVKGKSVLVIEQEKTDGKYYKLTTKSSDSSIFSLGKAKTEEAKRRNKQITTIPVEVKKAGKVCVTLTANDDLKSSKNYYFTWTELNADEKGTLQKDSLTVNKQETNDGSNANSTTRAYFTVGEEEEIFDTTYEMTAVVEDNTIANALEVKTDVGSNNHSGTLHSRLWVVPKENCPAKTYKDVKVKLTLQKKDSSEDARTYYVTFKQIKVIDKNPSVKFKQTKKVNLFYGESSQQAKGVLSVPDGVEYVNLDGCDYGISTFYDNGKATYYIVKKQDKDGKNKTGTLEYYVDGYSKFYQIKFTVATEKKAPALTASMKSDVLYPMWEYDLSTLRLTDKTTGESPAIDKLEVLVDKRKGTKVSLSEGENSENTETFKLSKNSYQAWYTLADEKLDSIRVRVMPEYNKGKDTITLLVYGKDWKEPVTVSYQLNVDNSVKLPKLQLGNAKLSLNGNEKVWNAEQVETKLFIKGSSASMLDQDGVYFVGKDQKSKKILNRELTLEYWNDSNLIVARLNCAAGAEGKNLQTGTYKYTAYLDRDGEKIGTDFTVTVTDKDPTACVKLTKGKGAIDLLLPESELLYNIKVSGVQGKPANAWLEGQDGAMFKARITEAGQLAISAEDYTFSTKVTYKVVPRIELVGEYGTSKTITAAPIQFKVTQSKVKIVFTPQTWCSNVIYRDIDNGLSYNVKAYVKDQEVAIDSVCLEDNQQYFDGYTDQGILYISVRHNEGEELPVPFYQAGKTWKLKFSVRLQNQGTDQKNVVVTYPIVIK